MPQPPDVIATKATNSLMPAARTPRAAQYVRMSTDHQSYSPANQADANVLAGPLNSGHGGWGSKFARIAAAEDQERKRRSRRHGGRSRGSLQRQHHS